MADQLSGGMGNLSLDSAPPQQPTTRSYIPPHMRNKMAASGPPPMNGPPGPQPGAVNGLNNSAWAG
jgi:ATP-dependent RNA helicase DDX3X